MGRRRSRRPTKHPIPPFLADRVLLSLSDHDYMQSYPIVQSPEDNALREFLTWVRYKLLTESREEKSL